MTNLLGVHVAHRFEDLGTLLFFDEPFGKDDLPMKNGRSLT